MRSIKFNRLKSNRQLISKSMELHEKNVVRSKLRVLGKSNSKDIFDSRRKRIVTEGQINEKNKEKFQQARVDNLRYKTEIVKDEKQQKNVFNDNIFSHLARKKQIRKTQILSQQPRTSDHIDIKMQGPHIVIRDFNEELNHIRKSNAVNLFKYKLARKQKNQYLFLPIHNFQSKSSQARNNNQIDQGIRESVNLPLIRQIAKKKQGNNRPSSLLMDIQKSLLVIDKKSTVNRDLSHVKFKDKSRLMIRGSSVSNSTEDLIEVSPWIGGHSTPPNEQFFS